MSPPNLEAKRRKNKAVLMSAGGGPRKGSCLRHRISGDQEHHDHNLRPRKDPRLGTALRHQRILFEEFGFRLSDDEPESESESETLPPDPNMVTTIDIYSYDTLAGHKYHFDKKSFRKTQKRLLKENYSNMVKNEAKNLKARDCECAQKAISFYNEKHGTDYEVVETRGSYSRLYIGFWFHCNFKAQLKSMSGTGDGRLSSAKLFFAELYRKQPSKLVVNNCQMLDGPGQRPYLLRSCKMCRDDQMFHPANGFKVGK